MKDAIFLTAFARLRYNVFMNVPFRGGVIMRKRFLCSAVFLAAAAFWAAPLCKAAAATTKRQIANSLRQTMSVDFEETPLEEVVNYLREILAVNVVLDDETDAGKFLTLKLRDVPASSVLHWIGRLTDLEYTVTDHAVYIAPRKRIALMGRAYFRQYDVTDLLVPLEGALGGDDDNNGDDDDNDNNDDDDDDDDGNRRTRARSELMQLILLFTGGPSNWDYFGVMGPDEDDNEDDRVSEEDMF